MLRIQLIDGPHNAPGQLQSKEQGQQHNDNRNQQQGLCQTAQHLRQGKVRCGYPQHPAVLQPQGVIIGALPHGGGIPAAFSGAGGKSLLHLLPPTVVFHILRAGGIIQHGAVSPDQGNPAGAGGKRRQKGGAAGFQAGSRIGCLVPELLPVPLGIGGLEHAQNQQHSRQQRHAGGGHDGQKNPPGHRPPSGSLSL